ncbi:MAG: ParB/RepB/Spo0J family partition protein [Bryobacterales bacterium]|nr:ParB/RepB/Spo0J family partition protein [Bryobacterales bacterium]
MAGREVLRVRVEELEPDDSQVRTEFEEEALQGLAASLKRGQLQPILAYRRNGRLVILDGERRWRASRLASLPTLDVIVVDDPEERGAVLERQLVANVQRENLSPLERARAIQRLLAETGWTAAKVADSIGISSATVSRAMALLELPEEIQRRVAAGTLPASTAYELAKSGDRGKQEDLARRITQEKLSRDRVAAAVRAKPAAKGSARVTAALGLGRTVTLAGPGLETLDQLIEWTEELLQRAKKARPRGVELATFMAVLRDEAKARGGAA